MTDRTPPAAQAPERCRSAVRDLARRENGFRLVRAVSWGLAIAGGVMAVAMGLDWFLRGDAGIRSLLLAAAAAGAYILWRRGVEPRVVRRTEREAAMAIERHDPAMGGRLVTALQLADADTLRSRGLSPSFYEQVRDAAEERVKSVSAAAILPARPLLKELAPAWGFVAILLVLAALNAGAAAIGLQRVLLPFAAVEWPNRTALTLLDVREGEPVRVVRGGTLVLEGIVSGAIPSTGTLRIQGGPGETDSAPFEIPPDGRFQVRYRPVNRDLTVVVAAGDAVSAPVDVAMTPPPEIVSIVAECVYPAYTHRAPERLEDGNLQAVFGTDVRLLVTASKDIAGASAVWEGETAEGMRRIDDRVAEIRFRVEQTRGYQIRLADDLGFQNEDPVYYRVEMIDNEYPRFESVSPSDNRRVTPGAVVPIEARVTDDYGVSELRLVYQSSAPGSEAQAIPIGGGSRHLDVGWRWELESLSLQPGQSLTWWLEARDEGEHVEVREWPVTRARRLEILSEPELTDWLNNRLEEILDEIVTLQSLQEETADAVRRISGRAGDAVSGVYEQTQGERWRQDRIARKTTDLSGQMARVVEDYTISRVGNPARIARLQRTVGQLRTLASADMPDVVLALEEALAALEGRE